MLWCLVLCAWRESIVFRFEGLGGPVWVDFLLDFDGVEDVRVAVFSIPGAAVGMKSESVGVCDLFLLG